MNSEQQKQVYITGRTIAVLATLLVLTFMAFARVDTYLKIKAVDDCGKVAQYEKTIAAESAKATYPVLDAYKNCLKDKGY